MNLPSHFKSCGLQFVIIKLNFSTSFRYVNSSYVCTILSKKVFLSIKFILQFNKKCSSSSMTSHIRHFLSATGVLGLVCRPLSIARVCELQRNFEIASRYRSFLTRYRYGSITKSFLKRTYVLNIGFAWTLCRFVNHDEMNLFLIAFLQSLANLLSISVMSKLRSLANFRTAVAHVVKPWWFNCTNSKNTFFASSLSGIWYNRLIYRNADICMSMTTRKFI